MTRILAWAAQAAGQPLETYEYEPEPLGPNEVEVRVEYCGVCHADISMLNNAWGLTQFPFVPGHEIVGRVVAFGDQVHGLKLEQRVGIGWNAGSCMTCRTCISGNHHLCATVQPTIVGRYGGYAERVRAQSAWTFPLPEGLDAGAVGPLLCGGIAVFAPLLNYAISPTARVGVIGIGGLGHLALKILKTWGCEITAFTSTEAKRDEALSLGAHRVLSSRDSSGLQRTAGSLDLLLITVDTTLDWQAVMGTLAPEGRAHFLGVTLDPVPLNIVDMIFGQKCVSASPTGSPFAISALLDFSARHNILPTVEHFPMSRAREAFKHLENGKARFRVVLDADFQ